LIDSDLTRADLTRVSISVNPWNKKNNNKKKQ
jgi:hypothetical protein